MIAARNLEYSVDGTTILDGINLESSSGSFVGILGPNGAGKSTLLRILMGLTTPTRGDIQIQGLTLAGLSRREIARMVAFVPQSQETEFDFKVEEVIAMGRTPYWGRFSPMNLADRRAIASAVASTQTQSLLNRNLRSLSGGERQRVFLARALAQTTPLLFLDEPTANLDLFHELALLELLSGLTKHGKTIVAVLHDLNLASRFCQQLMLLHCGRVVAFGSPLEVLTEAHLSSVFHVATKINIDPATQKPFVHVLGAAQAVQA